MKITLILACSLILTLASCKKDPGPGGNTIIATIVKHHDSKIPGATIYVKYGAKEFPGENLSNYDDSKVADNAGHAHFDDLMRGDYFFYSVGYDSTISDVVKGGVHYEITKKDKGAHIDITVAVTED